MRPLDFVFAAALLAIAFAKFRDPSANKSIRQADGSLAVAAKGTSSPDHEGRTVQDFLALDTTLSRADARIAFKAGPVAISYIDHLRLDPTRGLSALAIGTTSGGGAVERVRIDPYGKVGVGVKNPAFTLQVNGTVGANSPFKTIADENLASDIEPYTDSTAGLMSLKSVRFRLKDQPSADGLKQIGFLAQDVEKVFPEMVATDQAGQKYVMYSLLLVPLIKSLQEAQTELAASQQTIESLESRLAKLEKKVSRVGS